MKSIKEKAEENCIKYGSLGDIAYSEFVEGANYVLEQIEQLIYEKHVEGNLPLFDLTHLIDKLKEK
jgi:hypothetical protein